MDAQQINLNYQMNYIIMRNCIKKMEIIKQLYTHL